MSQELARYLLAAGSTTDTSGSVNYLLSVDPAKSFLNCQHWKGDTLSKQELLVESVRPGSTAAYLITSSDKVIICITPSSTLTSYSYDQDDREWVEADESPLSNFHVHPNGKLAGSVDTAGKSYVVFQDASQRLVSLISTDGDDWTSSTLPGSAIAGTPVSTLASNDGVIVFYISSTDNFIHVAIQGKNNSWTDKVASKYTFSNEVKALCAGDGEFYALTTKNGLFKVNNEGVRTDLGTIKDGKYVPGTVEEAGYSISWYPNGQVSNITVWW